MLKTSTPTLAAEMHVNGVCSGVFILFGFKHEARKHNILYRNVCCVFVALLPAMAFAVGSHTNPAAPHLLGYSSLCVFSRCNNETSHSVSPPSPFCLKSCDYMEEESTVPEAEKKVEQLKTERLKEYTIQSHFSMPQNNTYANFERFAHVVEDLSLMETRLSEVSEARHTLQGDVEALLSIYNDKEAWYKEESETARKQLSQVHSEFRKVEATRRLLQEDVKIIDASLESISGKYSHRESQLDALRQELNSELQWLQEVMSSLHPEGAKGSILSSSSSMNTDVRQGLLHQSCRRQLHPEDKQTLTESG